MRTKLAFGAVPGLALVSASSGGSSRPSGAPSTTASATTTTSDPTTRAGSTQSALQAEAHSAATGDIPDKQVFLTYRDPKAGWSMKYPEGSAESRSASNLVLGQEQHRSRPCFIRCGPLWTCALLS